MNIEVSCSICDRMTEDYNYLEDIMGDIYNGNLQQSEEILKALGELGQRMIATQKDFVFVSMGDDPSFQEGLISRLDDKSAALDKALSETSSRGSR